MIQATPNTLTYIKLKRLKKHSYGSNSNRLNVEVSQGTCITSEVINLKTNYKRIIHMR